MSTFSEIRLKFTSGEPLKYGANAAAEFDNPDWPRFVRITDIGDNGRLREETFRSLPPEAATSYLLQDGDLLLARSGATVGKSFIYEKQWGEACYAGYLIRLRASEEYDARYIYWCLQGSKYWSDIESNLIQATIQNVSAERYSNFRVPSPPLETQRRIARFLDEKTTRIDALISKKRALLERLAEKRQALITHAVTKGLNPDAPMKPSGIDWLGDIPASWQVKRLSFVADVIDCKHRTPEYIADGIPLVSTTEVKPFRIDYVTKRMVSDYEFGLMSEGGRKPSPGDIIYSRNASVGSAALVRTADQLCLGQDLCLIRPKKVDSEFLEFFINSRACLEQLDRELVGATFKRINVDAIKKYFTLLPPAGEQEKIAANLKERLNKEGANFSAVERSLDLLVEYRSAIITAAVTGKLRLTDVPAEPALEGA